MRLLYQIRDLFIDFLFPKRPRVLELESLSTRSLEDLLPQAVPLADRDCIALFDYSYPLTKEIIWELKYHGNDILAGKLGEILSDHLRDELQDLMLFENWRDPILVPIPVSNKRRFERGWNQSELLAKAVYARDSEKIFKYLPEVLCKVSHTESQTETRSKSERLLNLKNSMKVLGAPAVRGKCVIVLDDVTTTGATFAEAKRALRAAGASKILCVAVSH